MSKPKEVIANFSIFPLKPAGSMAPFVAKAEKIIEDSGLASQLGPMGTDIEGTWDEVMQVIDKCFKALEPIEDRIMVNFKADFRRGREGRLTSKVESVRKAMEQ
ncbi:MAG: hypothetical protein PWQ57_203 [Desulfovibrionales bacterium]|jgi:uncharacterized protein (TIGR00106 family)|nr:hypothetical protein [Desulfovibrionales bacterium]